MKFKQWLVRLLGIITTSLSLVLIYLILYKDGNIQSISKSMLIEFAVIVMLALSTKFFWYTSTESSIRCSEDYMTKRESVTNLISEEITDARDFDEFIDMENDINYNKYVSNKCRYMTVDNYKLSLFDWVHWLFKKKPKSFYMTRYMLKVERDANKQHKLSGSNIRSLTTEINGLTDDRNNANRKKIQFLTTGTIFSLVSMFVTAAITFTDKENFDKDYAMLKMIIYTTNIVFSVLQAILKARLTVATEDIAYFNKIVSIVEKYSSFKIKRYTIEKISYIPKEVENGSKNECSAKRIDVNTDGRSDGQCSIRYQTDFAYDGFEI